MKEAIGSYWLTLIFITFVILFTGYLCLSINMNKAYKVKNEIINILQKNNGFSEQSLKEIQQYMAKVGYRTKGDCDSSKNEYGFGLSGTSSSNRGLFCIKPNTTRYDTGSSGIKVQFPTASYFSVKVFFSIDMPVVRRLFTFQVRGSTKKMFNAEVLGG